MAAAEDAAKAAAGRMVLVETAGKAEYAATRAFYERIGYHEVARIPDFYRVGDDKVIYGKALA
jgi:ribosomal protein S18 acetylase RimI-like enzyme